MNKNKYIEADCSGAVVYIYCPNCNYKSNHSALEVEDGLYGKDEGYKCKCPKCGQRIIVSL